MGYRSVDRIAMGLGILAIGAMVGYPIYQDFRIKNNLEPDAVRCRIDSHVKPPVLLNIPMIKNIDLDGNGLYESVLIHTNDLGELVYQEVTKTENGLTLGAPYPWK